MLKNHRSENELIADLLELSDLFQYRASKFQCNLIQVEYINDLESPQIELGFDWIEIFFEVGEYRLESIYVRN